eukprot:TRINITY_DN16892_c0_g1_i2.p1 TRINITY_DN16892_c0_g1~~TRINITY_DN16892_c0_g1_i2.p1  ORF type:complete len:527 (-),score=122.41 TRINITY_DN16892_c0_g1_i2:259-1839(-)
MAAVAVGGPFPLPPSAPIGMRWTPTKGVDTSEALSSKEALIAVERLAEDQRRRLEELQEGHLRLEAAVRSLREQCAAEERRAPPATTVSPASTPSRDSGCERRWAKASAPAASFRAGSAPAPMKSSMREGLEEASKENQTPTKKTDFVPVWGKLKQGSGNDWAMTPPKVLKSASNIQDACRQRADERAEKAPRFEESDRPRKWPGSQDHMVPGGIAISDTGHGNPKDSTCRNGFAPGVGTNRRHIAVVDHITGGVAEDDQPRDKRWLGCGKKHFPEADKVNIHGGAPDDSADVVRQRRGHYVEVKDNVQFGAIEDRPYRTAKSFGYTPKDNLFGASQVQLAQGTFVDEYRGRARTPVGGEDHIFNGSCTEDDLSWTKRGRRYIGERDHLACNGMVSEDDAPGSFGNARDDSFQAGLPRGIGHGKHHIVMKDHLAGGGVATEGDAPGSHGHCRDDDFENGIERGIGHGKRHMASAMDVIAAEAAASPPPPRNVSTPWIEAPQEPTAGVPSRYCTPPIPAEPARLRMW